MIIKKAEFKCSSPRVDICPQTTSREFAFIGRSNVGKSSLINMLTSKKGLAKVSGTPGKTQMINHFEINSQWYLVDLPGYGYARVSQDKRNRFSLIIEGYVKKREQMFMLFVLIDVRHEPQRIDVEFMEFLAENKIPFVIVFTKSDKLSNKQLEESIERYTSRMLESWEEMPKYFITSSEKAVGKEEILGYIDQCLTM